MEDLDKILKKQLEKEKLEEKNKKEEAIKQSKTMKEVGKMTYKCGSCITSY